MRVTCIVLAAGLSRRFGKADKLLVEVDGRPLIGRLVGTALNARCDRVVVVIQPRAAHIVAALDGLAVTFCPNPAYSSGIGSSISAGIASLPAATDAALILPADMPWMETALIDRLIAAFEASGGKAVVYPTTASGKQRNPVLWPRSQFPALLDLNTDQGARGLIASCQAPRIGIKVESDAVFRDIDRPVDLTG